MSEEILRGKIDAILEAGDIMLSPPEDMAEFIDKKAVKQSRIDQIHEAYRSEVERAGEVGIDPHNYTNPTAIKIGIAMQQAHILKIFEGTSGAEGRWDCWTLKRLAA